MKREFPGYRRLARGAFSCSSLWAGDEHLLYVKGTGFLVPIVEEYRRLRYRDIQAVSFARTNWSRWIGAACLLGVLLGVVPAALASTTLARASSELPGTIALAVVTLVLVAPFLVASLAVLIWTVVRGPSATFVVQTSGATFVIRPANRLRAARALADELGPLVAARQRDLEGAAGPPPTPAEVGEESPYPVPAAGAAGEAGSGAPEPSPSPPSRDLGAAAGERPGPPPVPGTRAVTGPEPGGDARSRHAESRAHPPTQSP